MRNYPIISGPGPADFHRAFVTGTPFVLRLGGVSLPGSGGKTAPSELRITLTTLRIAQPPEPDQPVTHWKFEAAGPEDCVLEGRYNLSLRTGTLIARRGRLHRGAEGSVALVPDVEARP